MMKETTTADAISTHPTASAKTMSAKTMSAKTMSAESANTVSAKTASAKTVSATTVQIPDSVDQLAIRIKQAIRRDTSGRVHNLGVCLTGTHIVLEGFCSTFHCYQLAQHAAMQFAEDLTVDNQIEVL